MPSALGAARGHSELDGNGRVERQDFEVSVVAFEAGCEDAGSAVFLGPADHGFVVAGRLVV